MLQLLEHINGIGGTIMGKRKPSPEGAKRARRPKSGIKAGREDARSSESHRLEGNEERRSLTLMCRSGRGSYATIVEV